MYIQKLSLMTIVFGGLCFSAISYYLPIFSNPSWPFFIITYLSAIFLFLAKIKTKIAFVDIFFLLLISYIFLSFIFFGQSDPTRFYYYLILFMLLPYISGKTLGTYINNKDLNIILSIGLISLLIISIELVTNPSLLTNDRLILFTSDDYDGTGGSSIAINMNIVFGASAIILFYRSFFSKKYKSIQNGALCLIFIVYIIFFASRSGIVSIFVTFLSMYFLKNKLSPKSILQIFIFFLFAMMIFGYLIFNSSDDRLNLILDIPLAIQSASTIFGCNLTIDGSIISRIIMWSEAINLFLDNIIFGVGSSNYGYYYCGQSEDLASPHMYILHIASELGIIGVIFYILFLFFIFKISTKNDLHLKSGTNFIFLSIWIYLILISQFNGNYFYDLHIFFISGLLASMSKSNPEIR